MAAIAGPITANKIKTNKSWTSDPTITEVQNCTFKDFHFLAQFPFTTSETELDYYHQKVNARVAERLKT